MGICGSGAGGYNLSVKHKAVGGKRTRFTGGRGGACLVVKDNFNERPLACIKLSTRIGVSVYNVTAVGHLKGDFYPRATTVDVVSVCPVIDR